MAITDDLVESWSLDGNRDGASGSINLTQVGTAQTYTSAIVNDGIIAPGAASRYLTYPYSSNTPTGSIAFWYKSTGDGTGTFHRIWSKTTVGVSDRIVIALLNRGRRPYLVITDTVLVNETSDTLTRDVWYHHVITWDGTDVKWYINGTLTYSVSSSLGVATSATVYALLGWGSNTSQQPAGVLDIGGMWTRAITSGEVSTLYNGGAGLQYPFASSGSTIKTYNNVTAANVKTILNGTPIANRKTWNGIQ